MSVSALQLTFVLLTFVGPLLLWGWCRGSMRKNCAVGVGLSMLLMLAYVTAIMVRKAENSSWSLDWLMPMHLCDWAAAATVLALLRRGQVPFELAYFWGLAGTLQALFTPAVELVLDLRSLAFLAIHTVIPASVLFLMLQDGKRPARGALWRVIVWSQVYLFSALAVNAMTGANYGFLTERPAMPTLLDHFSEERWLYLLQLELLAFILFVLLYAPWWWLARRRPSVAAT